MYTNLAYVPPTYRRVKKLPVLVINKDVCKSISCKNCNYIIIGICNNPQGDNEYDLENVSKINTNNDNAYKMQGII